MGTTQRASQGGREQPFGAPVGDQIWHFASSKICTYSCSLIVLIPCPHLRWPDPRSSLYPAHMRSQAVLRPSPKWNEDVVREIVSHLSVVPERIQDFGSLPPPLADPRQPDETTLRRRTLASAARTCKPFRGPASEALWAVLPLGHGLLPLIRTFSGIWKGSIAKELPMWRRGLEITDYYVSASKGFS